MGTVGIVIRARRNQFDGIGAEYGQVANVLFPEREIPTVVGVGLRSIAQLMAAKPEFGGRGNVDVAGQGYFATCQVYLSEEPTDTEQHAAGIVADDKHRWRGSTWVFNEDLIALGPTRGIEAS